MAAAPDVIESPGGSEPSRKRRLIVVVAAIAATTLLTYLWLRAPSDPPPDTDPPPDAGPLPEQPDAGPLPTGLEIGRLLLPTRPPRLLNTADGSSQPIRALPGADDWTYAMHDLGDGRYVVTTRPYFSGQGTPPETSAYLVNAAAASATPIAAGDDIALGADNASILVTRFSQTAGHTVRRHRLDGRPVGPAFRLPPGRVLVRGTVAGLLLARDDGLGEIWDPATGIVHHEFNQYGAVGPDILSYNDHDAVVVVDLRTGASKRMELPDGAGNVHESSLSRDGRYLAVAVTNLHFTAWTIVVFDRASNVLTVAPGGPFQAAHQAQSLVMSWNGDLLTLVNRGAAFLWQPGTPSLHEVPKLTSHPVQRR